MTAERQLAARNSSRAKTRCQTFAQMHRVATGVATKLGITSTLPWRAMTIMQATIMLATRITDTVRIMRKHAAHQCARNANPASATRQSWRRPS